MLRALELKTQNPTANQTRPGFLRTLDYLPSFESLLLPNNFRVESAASSFLPFGFFPFFSILTQIKRCVPPRIFQSSSGLNREARALDYRAERKKKNLSEAKDPGLNMVEIMQ